MDPDAAARARRSTFKADLMEAYSDDEACVPEWVDLMAAIDETVPELHARVARAAGAFASEPDIRLALRRREQHAAEIRGAAGALNEQVRRLNLIAPHMRFQRAPVDQDELLRPLCRVKRPATS